MARRAGSADLPLHGGRVPLWLADRMTRLGAVISEAIIHAYGRDELLRRLAHPFWFQSFGAVMGMDWHSSGITTSVIGALKRGLEPLSGELGLHVCGGRGKHSRKTPLELATIGERVGFDGSALADVSRLVAKVDSAAVQDGFDLYLHGFIVTDDGQMGRRPAGHERFEPHGAPLSLAVGGPAELRRRAAQGDRRHPSRRNRQPHRSPRRRVPPGPARASGFARSRRPGARARRHRGEAWETRSPARSHPADPAPSRHACASRRARERRPGAAPSRDLHRGGQSGAGRLRRIASRPRRRRPHGAGARDGGRSGARRALSFHRSGALLVRPWRQGPASVPRAAQSL